MTPWQGPEWRGLKVKRVLDGGKRFLVEGWPRPIRYWWRVELPPAPGHPVHGPKAVEEARRILREARRAKVNLGWSTKLSVLKVCKAERPLSHSVWKRTLDYIARRQDIQTKPLRVAFAPGEGVRVEWRRL